ncbi:hypothetical protein KUV62_15785 [Salipiger bermudensis]|uniref:hypothetical protein n=1 Tax=Salipiger bermudensis TaxID=344736 RepID=UPI001C99D3F3|nr:hypothetical protein [Salipiger bermudensis]MBY6005386.1 hypothetical protein [Salipiger bermudensis]
MSTMHVTIGEAVQAGAPVFATHPRAAEAVTTSGTAASATLFPLSGEIARISAVDAALYVSADVTASATTGYYVAVGTTIELGPLKDGSIISGIEA